MSRDGLSRRRFLGAAGIAMALGSSARGQYPPPGRYPPPGQYLPPPGKYPPPPGKNPPPTTTMVRRNISTFTAQQIDSLRNGVAAMKARPVSDPTSWAFQANIHGTWDPPTSSLWNQCEHGTIQFLTWHRGYLYYFERILRDASGDPTLTLPYWDWTAQPALPLPFRDPADTSNPLYDDTRNINDGSTLPSSIVVDDLDTALAFIAFFPGPWMGFSGSLEGSPHGAVHGQIGGNMGSVPTAANDPIFWLHHCNIDRIWNRWLNLGGGRANPSDAAFLNQTYSYADVGGGTVSVRVADILTSAQLGYRYDDIPNPAAMRMMAATAGGALGQARLVATSAGSGAEAVAVEDKPLGLKAETVRLNVVSDAAPTLRAAVQAARPDRPGTMQLEVEGIRFTEAPSFNYEVLLNLPEDLAEAGAERTRAYHVGTVNFFGQGGHGGHGAADQPRTFNQSFDATRTVARLRDSRQWDPESLRVTLRPIMPVPPAGREDEVRRRAEQSADKAALSYRRINLRVAP